MSSRRCSLPRSTSAIRQTPPFMVTASGCAPPMPPQPALTTSRPASAPPKCCARAGREGLVGPLHDPLRADVDPRPGRHLPVHDQPLALQLVEAGVGRPVRHQVRVGDQHARRAFVRAQHADRLARLHQQRLVRLELLQILDDGVERRPRSRRLAAPAVDDQVRPDPRRPRGRGCSSTCAAPPRRARSCRCASLPGARGSAGRAPSTGAPSPDLIPRSGATRPRPRIGRAG